MQNPFNHENYPSNELKRNIFPCSFQNNLTMKYGYIYPAGIWRTVPGATYKIKPTLGLNFMPTTFPVQTRQKVYVHYFYGRDRNFWKDYKDFVNGQRPDLVKPYIDESVTKARTGKLLDYLGVPTTYIGRYGSSAPIVVASNSGEKLVLPNFVNTSSSEYSSLFNYPSVGDTLEFGRKASPDDSDGFIFPLGSSDGLDASLIDITFQQYKFGGTEVASSSTYYSYPEETVTNNNGSFNYNDIQPRESIYTANFTKLLVVGVDNKVVKIIDASSIDSDSNYLLFRDVPAAGNYSYFLLSAKVLVDYINSAGTSYTYTYGLTSGSKYNYNYLTFAASAVDIDDSTSPYWRSNDNRGKDTIKLNAYLPRFYETVYNLYYRNPQNNPYIIEGRPEYNKFIPTKDGGVDSNLYQLRRRNWEDDFLTTAVQSPQQGIAPLVGLTDRGATLTLTNDDGTITRYNVTTTENGSITGIEANDTSAEPVLTKALIDAVSYGISIEDIRNVNAMQKWLELNLRKGYQYKDIIQARWGISISYNELDLPEFIGGFTKDVQLQAVTQTANVNDDVTGQLGWQGGRLFASGEGREITHYCDEEGYIMCLITVVPIPNYSQLLPKHWFERDLLDSYQPEFNHIGFQPITYKEVCPVQAFQESTENVNVLEQTFGYQRPWYQYFNYTDEVHGQFRTSFKDFLINRVFDVKPELSESFLLVDPEQINDVFNVPDVEDDKIIGAIYHNCVAKLPISLYAQARLE